MWILISCAKKNNLPGHYLIFDTAKSRPAALRMMNILGLVLAVAFYAQATDLLGGARLLQLLRCFTFYLFIIISVMIFRTEISQDSFYFLKKKTSLRSRKKDEITLAPRQLFFFFQ